MRTTILSLILFFGFYVIYYASPAENITYPAGGNDNNGIEQNETLINNIENRNIISLNGDWNIIIDPYENGYYSYRYQPRTDGYFENRKPATKSELVEYDFDKSETLKVPGDWNTQKEKLFLYEGTVWYKKSFSLSPKSNERVFIYFGAVNYSAIVWVNGKKVGEHEGGFTAFNFEITRFVKEGDNFVIVKVDNKRKADGVPTLNTDWWNYGGITRDVYIVKTPDTFIRYYFFQLGKSTDEISCRVGIDGRDHQPVTLSIPDANINETLPASGGGFYVFDIKAKVKLWSPDDPFLYNIFLISGKDSVKDLIGFRKIEVKGNDIVLNGNPVFLKGISIHEEAMVKNSPEGLRGGRAYSEEDAVNLLTAAKELGCNFVRLAHYPHSENMVRQAEKMGIMVWSEIPVYWTIQWENENTFNNASNQLTEMIRRDRNRAAIIIWSVANETPNSPARMKFLTGLIAKARQMDKSRLISAATEVKSSRNIFRLEDPLSEYLDVIGVNEYVGWYSGEPEDAPGIIWESKFGKPLIISEFGADAKFGHHGDKDERWTEEYQENLYNQQIKMLRNIPFLRGVTPWILMDFRSPRRPLPGIQDFWNRKGLISEKGEKKLAFKVLQEFYKSIKN